MPAPAFVGAIDGTPRPATRAGHPGRRPAGQRPRPAGAAGPRWLSGHRARHRRDRSRSTDLARSRYCAASPGFARVPLTGPRHAADLVDPGNPYGRAFGVERAGDKSGAILGPLLASVLVAVVGVRHAILLSIIPGILAAVAITIAAREAHRADSRPLRRRTLALNLRELRGVRVRPHPHPDRAVRAGQRGHHAAGCSCHRSAARRRPQHPTAATSVAILLYVGHNAAASASRLSPAAWPTGPRPDRVRRRRHRLRRRLHGVRRRPSNVAALLVGFLLAGVGIGAAEPAESTVVARELPETLRGNGFGYWAWCRPSAIRAPPSWACCGRCCRSAPEQCCVSHRTQPETLQ